MKSTKNKYHHKDSFLLNHNSDGSPVNDLS